MVTTAPTVPGREIDEVVGIVRGNSVRAKNVGRDITQAVRNFFGGELPQYGELLSDTRDEAFERMVRQAEADGAEAVVEMRIETSQISGAAGEIHAYGTAVTLR